MKISLILLLYDELIDGDGVSREEFCEENSISERTFYRYMGEISKFLRAYNPAYVIDLPESHGRYILKKV